MTKRRCIVSTEFCLSSWFSSFKFKTGNAENPSDQLHNTSVLVAPAKNSSAVIRLNGGSINKPKSDPFLTVGRFNSLGFVEGKIDSSLGPISELRLLVHQDSENWIILSEVSLH